MIDFGVPNLMGSGPWHIRSHTHIRGHTYDRSFEWGLRTIPFSHRDTNPNQRGKILRRQAYTSKTQGNIQNNSLYQHAVLLSWNRSQLRGLFAGGYYAIEPWRQADRLSDHAAKQLASFLQDPATGQCWDKGQKRMAIWASFDISLHVCIVIFQSPDMTHDYFILFQ